MRHSKLLNVYFVLALVVTLTLTACSKSTTLLQLAPGVQKLPMPKFTARDPEGKGQRPRYSELKVHELTEACQLTDCPVVWDVVVAEEHSPTEFVYGGFPGFGSQTIVSARELKSNQRYLLVAYPAEQKDRSGFGTYHFRITNDGLVVPD